MGEVLPRLRKYSNDKMRHGDPGAARGPAVAAPGRPGRPAAGPCPGPCAGRRRCPRGCRGQAGGAALRPWPPECRLRAAAGLRPLTPVLRQSRPSVSAARRAAPAPATGPRQQGHRQHRDAGADRSHQVRAQGRGLRLGRAGGGGKEGVQRDRSTELDCGRPEARKAADDLAPDDAQDEANAIAAGGGESGAIPWQPGLDQHPVLQHPVIGKAHRHEHHIPPARIVTRHDIANSPSFAGPDPAIQDSPPSGKIACVMPSAVAICT